MTESELLPAGDVAIGAVSEAADDAPSGFESHRYCVRTEWRGRPEVVLASPGKPNLEVARSTEFPDGVPDVWSPEELLIASLATCFELTLRSIAGSKGVPIQAVRVDATGHVERRRHRYRVVLVELDAHVETETGREPEIERIAELASEACLVANALDIPVRLSMSTVALASAMPRTPESRRGS